MISLVRFFRLEGLLVSTMIGAGIFALPYIFYKSGWVLGIGYLLFFGVIMTIAHSLYWRVLVKISDRKGLLGLTRDYLGAPGFYIGFLAILGGLLLSLVAFLILSSSFMVLIFPGVNFATSVIFFWLLATIPLFLRSRRFLGVELFGGVVIVAVVFLILFSAFPLGDLPNVPKVNWGNLFLPFGAILFSLGAWTAIEPMIDSETQTDKFKKGSRWREVFSGASIVVIVYLMFVLAVLSSGGEVAPDAISGLSLWGGSRLVLLGILGLFSIWTTYLPIALESRVLIERDLKSSRRLSLGLVSFLPIVLVFMGLNSFLDVVFLVGGVFLAAQYLLIVLVARKILDLGFKMRVATLFMALIFLVGAVYEIYYFIVR